MKKLLFGALAATMFTACSNDELTSINRDGDEIAFNVVTNLSTRATDVYCNNNLPGEFKVWATFDNATYIDGDEIQSQSGKWVNNSGTRYWPDGEVKFFAQQNAGSSFQWNDGKPTIKDFNVPTAVGSQQDLIYAVKAATKGTDGQVTLNFRHALSQIVFSAKNTNANLYVEISGVSVCKLGNTNTFTYGTNNTGNNIENHDGTIETITYDGSWGTWAELKGGTTDYSVTFDAVNVAGNNTVVALTSANDNGKEFSSNAMLLLPQTTTAWSIEKGKGKPVDQTGTYFLVKCRIWNVAGTVVDKSSDVCLWGKDGADDIAIPVTLKWEQGKKYLYTFVFGDGNGGYDPDPDPDDPDPDPTPVLVPITFDVTVDDFVPVANQDIEMDKP